MPEGVDCEVVYQSERYVCLLLSPDFIHASVSLVCQGAVTDAWVTHRRQRRLIYQDPDLHVTVLQLILSLMLTPRGTLQPLYADVEPSLNHRMNVLFLLTTHLNDPENEHCIPVVRRCFSSRGEGRE